MFIKGMMYKFWRNALVVALAIGALGLTGVIFSSGSMAANSVKKISTLISQDLGS